MSLLRTSGVTALLIGGLLPGPARGPQSEIDPASLDLAVLLMNGGQAVSQGTGFFGGMASDGTIDTVFLVTNYPSLRARAALAAARARGRIRFVMPQRHDLGDVRVNCRYATRQRRVGGERDLPRRRHRLVPIPTRAYRACAARVH
jgi:hypothetical protein